MNQQDVPVGDQIVKVIIGGGFETCSIAEIEHVSEDTIYLKGCDGWYDRESLYAYNLHDGRSVNNFIPGFSSRLILLEQ